MSGGLGVVCRILMVVVRMHDLFTVCILRGGGG